MIKQAITDALKSTLGKYVKDLDVESLSVSLWEGSFELPRNLKLDVDALNKDFFHSQKSSIGLSGLVSGPATVEVEEWEINTGSNSSANNIHNDIMKNVKVVSGSIGKIQMEVPWNGIANHPVVVRISNVKIVLGLVNKPKLPEGNTTSELEESKANRFRIGVSRRKSGNFSRALNSHVSYDLRRFTAKTSREEITMKKARKDTILKKDNARKQRKISASFLNPFFSPNENDEYAFRRRLKRRVMENMQLDINDVHIQLTDDSVCTGIVIESISFDTTDENGRRLQCDRRRSTSYDKNSSQLFKALRISNVGVYLETENEGQDEDLHTSSDFRDDVSCNSSSVLNRNYVIPPLSFEAAYHQSDGKDIVQHLLFSQLPHLSVVLSRSQLLLLNEILKCLSPSSTPPPLFPQYRPIGNVSGNGKLWWKYAYNGVGRLTRRTSWITFFKAFQIRKRYLFLYKRHAHKTSCTWLKPLTTEELEELQQIEDDRFTSIEGIVQWRAMVDKIIQREINSRKDKNDDDGANNSKRKRLASVKRFLSKKRFSEEDDLQLFSLSEQEMTELSSQLEYPSDSGKVYTRRKQIEVEISIEYIVMDILEGTNFHPIAKLRFGAVDAGFSLKEKEMSYAFSLLSLQVEDLKTLSPMFPTIMRSIHERTEDENSGKDKNQEDFLVALNFRIIKNLENEDISVKLRMIAFEFVFSTSFISNILNFFSLDSTPKHTGLGKTQKSSILSCGVSGLCKKFFDSCKGYVQDFWERKKTQSFKLVTDCMIDAPVLILPLDVYNTDTVVLIFDLGSYHIYSPESISDNLQDYFTRERKTDENVFKKECWKIESKNFTIFSGCASAFDWLQIKEYSSENSLHGEVLLEPAEVSLEIGTCSSVDRFAMCINYEVNSLSLRTEPQKICDIFAIIRKLYDVCDKSKQLTKLSSNRRTTEADFPQLVKRKSNLARVQEIYYQSISLRRVSCCISVGIFGSSEFHIAKTLLSYSNKMNREDNKQSSQFELKVAAFWMNFKLKPSDPTRFLLHTTLPISFDLAHPTDYIFHKISQSDLPQLQNNLLLIRKESQLDSIASQNLIGIEKAKSFVQLSLSNIVLNWYPGVITLVNESFLSARAPEQEENDNIDTPSGFADVVLEICYSFFSKAKKHFPILSTIAVSSSNKISQDQLNLDVSISSIKFQLFYQKSSYEQPVFLFFLATLASQIQIKDENTTDFTCDLEEMFIDVNLLSEISSTYKRILSFSKSSKLNGVIGVTYKKEMRRNEVDSLEKLYAATTLNIAPLRFVYSLDFIQYLWSENRNSALGNMFGLFIRGFLLNIFNMCYSPMGEQIIKVETYDLKLITPQSLSASIYFESKVCGFDLTCDLYPFRGGGKAKIRFNDIGIQTEDEKIIFKDPVSVQLEVVIPPIRLNVKEQYPIKFYLETNSIIMVWNKKQILQLLSTLYQNQDLKDVEEKICESLNHSEKSYGTDNGSDNDSDSPYSSFTNQDISECPAKEQDYISRDQIQSIFRKIKNKVIINIKCGLGSFQTFSDTSGNEPLFDLTLENVQINLKISFIEDTVISDFKLGHFELEDLRKDSILDQKLRHVIKPRNDIYEGKQSYNLKLERSALKKTKASVFADVGIDILINPSFFIEVMKFLNYEQLYFGHDIKVPRILGVIEMFSIIRDSLRKQTEEMYLSLKTEDIRFVFLEIPADTEKLTQFNDSDQIKCLVLNSRLDTSFSRRLSVNDKLRHVNSELLIKINFLQIFRSSGIDFSAGVLILDPLDMEIFAICTSSIDDSSSTVQMNLKLQKVFYSLSFHDMMLIASICNNAYSCMMMETVARCGIKEKLINNLNHLKNALVTSNEVDFQLDFESPQLTLLLINDCENCDEAVAKFVFSSIKLNGNGETILQKNVEDIARPLVGGFSFSLRLDISSDYFDAVSLSWSPLISEKVGISMSLKRTEISLKNAFHGRYYTITTIDIAPLSISLDDQYVKYLTNLASKWFENEIILSAFPSSDNNNHVPKPNYIVENNTGIDIEYFISPGKKKLSCPSSKNYFSFQHDGEKGAGTRRTYGADIKKEKTFSFLKVGSSDAFEVKNLDSELDRKRSYNSKPGEVFGTQVIKSSNLVLLRLRSRILVRNRTQLSYEIHVKCRGKSSKVGVLENTSPLSNKLGSSNENCIGVPDHLMQGYFLPPKNESLSSSGLFQIFSPPTLLFRILGIQLGKAENHYYSSIIMPSFSDLHREASKAQKAIRMELLFKPENSLIKSDEFVAHAVISIELIDNQPFIDICIEPRLTLRNMLPTALHIVTSSLHTFSSIKKDLDSSKTSHLVKPYELIEIFSAGESISVSFKFAEKPVSQKNNNAWIESEIHELHFGSFNDREKFCLISSDDKSDITGEGFVIVSTSQSTSLTLVGNNSLTTQFSLMPKGIVIDHSKVFFGEVFNATGEPGQRISSKSSFSVFSNEIFSRFMLFTNESTKFQFLLKDENSVPKKRSKPMELHKVEEGIGGFQSEALLWDDHSLSGFYLYKKIVSYIENILVTELHIIPAHMIINQTNTRIMITYCTIEKNQVKLELNSQEKAPLLQLMENSDVFIQIQEEVQDWSLCQTLLNEFGAKVLHTHSSRQNKKKLIISTTIGGESERILVHITEAEIGKSVITSSSSFQDSLFGQLFMNDTIKVMFTLQEGKMNCAISDMGSIEVKIKIISVEYHRLCMEQILNAEKIDVRSQLVICIGCITCSDIDYNTASAIRFLKCSNSAEDAKFLNISVRYRDFNQQDQEFKIDKLTCNIDQAEQSQVNLSLSSFPLSKLVTFMIFLMKNTTSNETIKSNETKELTLLSSDDVTKNKRISKKEKNGFLQKNMEFTVFGINELNLTCSSEQQTPELKILVKKEDTKKVTQLKHLMKSLFQLGTRSYTTDFIAFKGRSFDMESFMELMLGLVSLSLAAIVNEGNSDSFTKDTKSFLSAFAATMDKSTITSDRDDDDFQRNIDAEDASVNQKSTSSTDEASRTKSLFSFF